jgi:hypothetical protein
VLGVPLGGRLLYRVVFSSRVGDEKKQNNITLTSFVRKYGAIRWKGQTYALNALFAPQRRGNRTNQMERSGIRNLQGTAYESVCCAEQVEAV